MLEIIGLSAAYGKKQVLFDINTSLGRGKFTAIIGRNGSGKSTLAKLFNKFFKSAHYCTSISAIISFAISPSTAFIEQSPSRCFVRPIGTTDTLFTHSRIS